MDLIVRGSLQIGLSLFLDCFGLDLVLLDKYFVHFLLNFLNLSWETFVSREGVFNEYRPLKVGLLNAVYLSMAHLSVL